MENGPNLELEELRTFVFEALRYFNSQSDRTNTYPDKKIIGNLQSKVEDLIFIKHPTSYAGQDKRMNENNRHYFLEVIHNLLNEGVIMWGNASDSDTKTHPYFSITSNGQKCCKKTFLLLIHSIFFTPILNLTTATLVFGVYRHQSTSFLGL